MNDNDDSSTRRRDEDGAQQQKRQKVEATIMKEDDNSFAVVDSNVVDEFVHRLIDSLKQSQKVPRSATNTGVDGSTSDGMEDNKTAGAHVNSSSTTTNASKNKTANTNTRRIIELKDELTLLRDIKEKVLFSIEKIMQPKLDEFSSCLDIFYELF